MKYPTKIKVGAVTYKVEYKVIEAEEDYCGRCLPGQLTIIVDKRLPQDRKIQTLVHEIVHAICFDRGVSLKEAHIDGIATSIITLMKDNLSLKKIL